MQEVSVIIPNYNGMAYLEGVLSSLEQQEFQNFETILVDNGSSDGSVAFVIGEFSLGYTLWNFQIISAFQEL